VPAIHSSSAKRQDITRANEARVALRLRQLRGGVRRTAESSKNVHDRINVARGR